MDDEKDASNVHLRSGVRWLIAAVIFAGVSFVLPNIHEKDGYNTWRFLTVYALFFGVYHLAKNFTGMRRRKKDEQNKEN